MKRLFTIIAILLGCLHLCQAQTGTWSGKLDVQGTKLSLVFHLDDENPTLDSPDQGARDIPIEVQREASGKITVRIPSIGAAYEGLWLLKQIVGTFRQAGASFPLTLTPGEEKLRRPQTPVGPFPYAQEEVSFTNGDATLQGTLVLPEGWNRQTPALIMVTGSGLQNRDEELFEHKPFAVIADALARAGIATLRYDDRWFGASTGDLISCTTEDFKNDAFSGLQLLRQRFDKVGVIGHSEGGTIALMLAAEGQADFIVSLAGMIVSGAETLLWQNKLAITAAGLPEPSADAYCKLLGESFEAIATGKPVPSEESTDLPTALKQNYAASLIQLQTPYMKHFLTLDVRPLLGTINCPVLALNGTKDLQVECNSNLNALRTGLPTHVENRVQPVEGVNHLFQHCATGAATEYKDIEETFAPEVLDLMVSWIIARK